MAWWWMHFCAKSVIQKISCLRNVLNINPNNISAKYVLEKIAKSTEGKIKEPEKIFSSSNKQHFFNINIYNPVKIKHGENLFEANENSLVNFPEIDSGMFGSKFFVRGIPISPYDYPVCIEIGQAPQKSYCYSCEFFAESDCPIRDDDELLRDTKVLFASRRRYWQDNREKQNVALEAIFHELKTHGRPLHYEIITKIIKDRYPKLGLRPKEVLRIMGWHSEKFERVDSGVYKAK